jgi:hypothetical protein
MTSEEFVAAIKIQTSDAAVAGTITALQRPAGRKPRAKDIELSQWFNKLERGDQEMLGDALREAAELAVFSFLSVLDGVSVIEDSPDKGDLELYFAKGSDRIRLNNPPEELHNLFNLLCRETQPPAATGAVVPYAVGQLQELKEKLTAADLLDVHSVAAVHDGPRGLPSAPAIALPKSEHRKL